MQRSDVHTLFTNNAIWGEQTSDNRAVIVIWWTMAPRLAGIPSDWSEFHNCTGYRHQMRVRQYVCAAIELMFLFWKWGGMNRSFGLLAV